MSLLVRKVRWNPKATGGGTQPFFPIRPLKSPILPIADTAHRVLVAVAGRGAGWWWGWPPLRFCGWFDRAAAPWRHRTACAADVPWRRAAQLLSNRKWLAAAWDVRLRASRCDTLPLNALTGRSFHATIRHREKTTDFDERTNEEDTRPRTIVSPGWKSAWLEGWLRGLQEPSVRVSLGQNTGPVGSTCTHWSRVRCVD